MGDDNSKGDYGFFNWISIHVPRMGDDPAGAVKPEISCEFLSTSPVWGTTFRLTGFNFMVE